MEQKSSKYDYSTGSPEDRVKMQLPWLHPQLFFFNLFIIKMLTGDFPGNPLFKTLRFHCRGYGLDPWLGNWDIPCHRVWPKIVFLNCEYLWNRDTGVSDVFFLCNAIDVSIRETGLPPLLDLVGCFPMALFHLSFYFPHFLKAGFHCWRIHEMQVPEILTGAEVLTPGSTWETTQSFKNVICQGPSRRASNVIGMGYHLHIRLFKKLLMVLVEQGWRTTRWD